MTVQHVVCREPGKVELEETTLAPLRPNQLRIETETTAISPGTERAWFLKKENTPVKFPYFPGYCNVGRIVEVGAQVKGFEAGERVVSAGNHASVVQVDAGRAVRVPDGVSADHAPFSVLASISLQGVRKARVALGSPAAVLGAGLIGLLAMLLTRISGANPVYVADLSAHRRDLALRLGATRAVDPDELVRDSASLARRDVPDPGFDVVIDATGHPNALRTAIEVASTLARVVILGSTRGTADGINAYAIHSKGLHIIGAHARIRPERFSSEGLWTVRDDLKTVLGLMDRGALDVTDLITDRIGPQDVPKAFARLEQGDDRMLGCVIDWSR